jgi:4-alpha-glucanotransferase
VTSPGELLLALLWLHQGLRGRLRQGRLPLVAEDLGVITPAVEALRDRFALPGMKILQFAFDGNADNPYLPANIHGSRWVVYTGTHDNATAIGWWQGLDHASRQRLEHQLGAAVQCPGVAAAGAGPGQPGRAGGGAAAGSAGAGG